MVSRRKKRNNIKRGKASHDEGTGSQSLLRKTRGRRRERERWEESEGEGQKEGRRERRRGNRD